VIARVLDFLDHTKLARTVILQARQLDHLDRLCTELQAALEVAEITAVAYTPGIEHVRDAATVENRVLSLCESWRADRERDAASRLNAAEGELASARAEIASLRRELVDLGLERNAHRTTRTQDPPRTLPSSRGGGVR
jgi:hypothetical protein